MGNIIDLVNEYPIFKEQKMKLPLQSIVAIDDEHTDDRAFLVDMMDTWSSDDHDTFFNDMLCAINFIRSKEHIAYTDINRIISLNYPCHEAVVPFDDDRFMRWYFIYCHECLHQLWDTFEVGDKIKQEGITYNHMLLNIASDTIINDFLAYINKSHKKEPLKGWNPKVLKNEFGIDYDRKVDTQFTLYKKLLEVAPEKIEKAQEKYGGEIEPKEVRKSNQQAPGGGNGNGMQQKHSDEYKKGYSDAIKDVVDKKVDPLTKKPLPETDDYNKGYNDAIAEIKQGLEDGIEIMDAPSGGGGSNNSDLPDIPWKMPKSKSSSSGSSSNSSNNNNNDSSLGSNSKSASNSSDSAQDSANKAKQAASEAQDKADKASGAEKKKLQKEADKKKKLADKAQSEADKAKEAAEKAKEAEENGDEKGAEKAMNDAQKAADNAQNAAGEAMDKSAGDYAKDADSYAKEAEEAAKEAKENASKNGSKSAKEAAKEAAEKAKHAKEMAKEAKEAANRGDKDAAKAAANSARSDRDVAKGLSSVSGNANDDKNDNNDGSSSAGGLQKGPGGKSGSNVDSEVVEHAKRLAEQAVQKARKDPDGKLKDFLDKCKSSYKLKQEGLAMNSMRGSSSWKKEVPLMARHFVKRKLRSRKEYRNTYNRIRRGERAFTDADLRNGRIIQQGREEVKNKIGFDISVFIDVSGSMENFLKDVCTSAYSMMDSLKRDFGAEKNVDVKKINLRTFVFDTRMAEKPYGTRVKSSGGGTYDFNDLMVDVMKNGAAAFVNFIFTDGYFSDIPVDKLVKSFEKMEGLTILIVNNKDSKPTFDKLQKLCEHQAQSKFKVVYADTNFAK